MAALACFSAMCTRIPQQYLCNRQILLLCARPTARFGQSLAVYAASKGTHSSATRGGKKSRKPKDDPWESLFKELEKDLENGTEGYDDTDITEEDMAKFERELDSVFRDFSDESSSSNTDTADDLGDAVRDEKEEENGSDDDDVEDAIIVGEIEESIEEKEITEEYDEDEEEEEEEEEWVDDDADELDKEFEEPRKVKLERWQLKKLAAAVELGRRKVHVKSLAAELQLDRADVLSFLKDPPPELLLIALEEPAKEEETESGNASSEANSELTAKKIEVSTAVVKKIEKSATMYGPRDWNRKKRFRKEHLETFEQVYTRTRRPTNSMIQSLVHLTNLPRKRILEWFENRRLQSGVQNTSTRKTWRLQAKTVVTSFSTSSS